ncbi:MAG: homoserine kinase [Chthoniobacterales bacterium]
MESISVRVPATSANLGPGFDCLGVALDLHGQVTVTRGPAGAPDAMVDSAARSFFDAAAVSAFAFAWSVCAEIPRSRGLGSSVVVRLGILHGLNELAGRPLDAGALYRLCARLEGHPDNAAPAAFGGFTTARPDSVYFRCEIAPELRFVLLVPGEQIETDHSRVQLPREIPHADAAINTALATMITAAFASRDYELLRGSMDDRLHQPYRAPGVPHLRRAIDAGVDAGALGGYLSGSGSAVACITLAGPTDVAAAMQSVLPSAQVMVLGPDNRGVVIGR